MRGYSLVRFTKALGRRVVQAPTPAPLQASKAGKLTLHLGSPLVLPGGFKAWCDLFYWSPQSKACRRIEFDTVHYEKEA